MNHIKYAYEFANQLFIQEDVFISVVLFGRNLLLLDLLSWLTC